MEIIEIGAIRLDADLVVIDEFASFVRPVLEPMLSDFCKELTAISQDDVDGANLFPVVFARFHQWIGGGPYRFCSWGFYDVGQFWQDCGRHGVEFPSVFEDDHINVKKEYAAWKGVPPCGMARALKQLDLPLEGTHHRGIATHATSPASRSSRSRPSLTWLRRIPPKAGNSRASRGSEPPLAPAR